MFLLRAVLNILVRNASPRGPMCFRCLIFNLSGPCELLFLLCFIASWTVSSAGTSTGVIESSIKVLDGHLGFLEHLLEWFNPL